MRSLFARRSARRSLRPLVWATLPVLGLAMGVLASGVGIDLLLVTGSGLLMFTLERTVGDWMGEKLGPAPATVGFALILAGFTWFVIDSSDQFLTAAENRGYRGVYYRTGTASAASIDSAESDGSRNPLSTTGGTSTSSRDGVPVSSRPSSQGSVQSEPTRQPSRTGGSEEGQPKRQASASVRGARIVSEGQRAIPVGAQTAIALNIVPQTVSPGRRVRFEATVTSNGRPVNEGAIEFLVNGVAAKRVAVDSQGVAAMAYSSSFAGAYEVRARFLGTYRYQASSNTLGSLTVQQR